MSISLRDQLLQAGLGTKQQAKQSREDQHRHRHQQQHQQRKGRGGAPVPAAHVDPAKLARDQALEAKKRDKAERKEKAAQIRQICEQQGLPRLETDDYFNFVDSGRIARVAVDPARRAALLAGTLGIVRSHGQYVVVPVSVLPQVRERNPRAVVVPGESAAAAGPPGDPALAVDDPYARFQVPDDLIW